MPVLPPDAEPHAGEDPAKIYETIVIGAGFGGICMGVALRRAGVENFLILEKSADLGGVWRDNTYPGAACDVPSHLYSFSFAPNSDWSHTYARQAEIHAYLHDCARRFAIDRHIRCQAAVDGAAWIEARAMWEVQLASGERLFTRLLVSATGLLGRPVLPSLPGLDGFRGRAFHSAQWDHACSLAGKRVGVIGTGASATQFIPAIAGQVAQLTVFQRSPSYILKRGDQPYPAWRKTLFRHLPSLMRLHRALIYTRFEARAMAFTRMKNMMWLAVGKPFRQMLTREIPDSALRARLTPGYPIGCKRVLLSDDYLPVFGRPQVRLISEPIARVTADGIETRDGAHHPCDVIIYGTGFAATDFLAPMRIVGRHGHELNTAWQAGAEAYLGMSVPGFPNFFMLYGPNTNLGHNSIIYMLESQVAHIMRCRRALIRTGAMAVEVEAAPHGRFNARLRRYLAGAVWQGCTSWYLDRHGHNSANWPGFTFTYRFLTRYASLLPYRFTTPLSAHPGGVAVHAPRSFVDRCSAVMQRAFLRCCFKPFIGPPFSAHTQRRIVGALAPLMPGAGGVTYRRMQVQGRVVEIVAPAQSRAQSDKGAILYLHGGAFSLASPRTHRSITSRLARGAGMPVWVPDYRLAPEHPCPAAFEDALACFEAMLAEGVPARRIVLAGDSAGAALALALAIRLHEREMAPPAGLALVSPVTQLAPPAALAEGANDPMVRAGWSRTSLAWYAATPEDHVHHPLRADLRGLPPMLVQAGEQEILLPDATLLVEHAHACGVDCRFELHRERWHVFHLQAFYLRSAANAIGALAQFARERAACADEEEGRSVR